MKAECNLFLRKRVSEMASTCQVLDLAQYREEKLAAQAALETAARTKDITIFITMLKSINNLMHRRGLKKIRLKHCILYPHIITPTIRPLKTSTEGCPQCGSQARHYMQTGVQGTKRDYVIWGCRVCGTVYGRWETNEPD